MASSLVSAAERLHVFWESKSEAIYIYLSLSISKLIMLNNIRAMDIRESCIISEGYGHW